MLPAYLRDVYSWAYLSPRSAGFFDRQFVVQCILWGNAQRLIDGVLAMLEPGEKVFQPAAVYGTFSRQVAQKVGSSGRLEIRDIAPLQVGLTRRKVADLAQAHVALGNAADPDDDVYDAVTCFFLLHEVPDEVKRQVVPAMLRIVRPGGKAIFVDYHRPHRVHPLKPVMKQIFRHLEPFAMSLWSQEIEFLAGSAAADFVWSKSTHFGGMYQTVIAQRQ